MPTTRSSLLLAAALAAGVLAGCGDDPPERAGGARDVDRELIAAAYRNDVRAARGLIEAGADVNVKDHTEQSAYLIATSEVGDDPRLLGLRSPPAPTSMRRTATTAPA